MALPALLAGGSRALATGSRLARTANVGRKLLGTKSKKNKQGQVGEDGPSALTVRPSTTMVPRPTDVSVALIPDRPLS